MDEHTKGQKISPFYRTSSPIGAAALLYIQVNYQILKQGKGTADLMMPLGDWFFIILAIDHSNPILARFQPPGDGPVIIFPLVDCQQSTTVS